MIAVNVSDICINGSINSRVGSMCTVNRFCSNVQDFIVCVCPICVLEITSLDTCDPYLHITDHNEIGAFVFLSSSMYTVHKEYTLTYEITKRAI